MASRLYILTTAIMAISVSSSCYASPKRIPDKPNANVYISKALSTARSISDPFTRIDTLHSIARAQTLVGDYAGVQRTAHVIASSNSEPEIRSSTVGEIGDDLAWIGQRDSGIAILRSAFRQALTIKEPRSRSLNLWVISRWFESAGDVPDTLQAVTHITDSTVRSRGQAVRAGAYAKAGAFARALFIARAIPEPDIRDMALEEIAVIQYKAGATKAGLATIRSIKQADSAKVMGLTQIAALQWLAHDRSTSNATTAEAYRAATSISDPRDQVLALDRKSVV